MLQQQMFIDSIEAPATTNKQKVKPVLKAPVFGLKVLGTFDPRTKDGSYKVTASDEAARILRENWPDDSDFRESFFIIALNRANKVIGIGQISSGGVSGTVADPKIVFAYALTIPSCSSLILAHNHPSGNLEPSFSDISLTKKLKQAGDVLDLPVLDHIILTGDKYYSFADRGNMS